MEESDTNNFFDNSEAEYSPKSEFSKPRVAEDAVRRCMELRAKEMKAGYFNTKFTKEGLPLKIWIEDSRKVYVSSIISLKKLLGPEIRKDDKYKHIKLGRIREKYSYYKLKPKAVNGKIVYKRSNEYYIPDIDEALLVKKIHPNGSESVTMIKGFWNQQVNAYWDHMVLLCDKMFDELISVIHRKNYFKQGIRFG